MPRKLTNIFLLSIFVFAIFFTSVFSQVQEKFPYKVNLTEEEIRFLNSLKPETLQKIIDLAKRVYENNLAESKKPLILTNGQQINQAAGQNIGTSNGSQTGQNQVAQNNPYLNSGQNYYNNPNQNLNNPYGVENSLYRYTPKVLEGGNIDGSTFDLSSLDVKDIDPMCKKNYGIDIGGSCPDVEKTSTHLKNTAMKACTVIKKRLLSVSVYRTPACNMRVSRTGPNGPHTTGKAIDLSMKNLTKEEKIKVLGVFKLNGFNGVGCYGLDGHVHLDHGIGARRWGSDCPAEVKEAGF